MGASVSTNAIRMWVEYECPQCGETPASESFKGRIHIFDSEKSEMAENMKINKEGEFAIKSK